MPAKRTASDLEEEPVDAWRGIDPGKLRRDGLAGDPPGPAEALELARGQLAADRGWAPVSRKAEAHADIVDDAGQLARAFDFVAQAAGGIALPAELRARLEAELGTDLGAVRIHTDSRAASAAAQLGARAFTIESNIYFGAGAYDPDSEPGIELIAHEVAHVAQNLRGDHGRRERPVSRPDDAHERRADEFARTFVQRRTGRFQTNDPAELVEHVRRAGHRLEIPNLGELESELGAKLAHVEAFTGEAAVRACRWMQAGAFAVRNIVAFADPSPRRDQLLHELAHVLQSDANRAPIRFERGSLRVADTRAAAERDAWSAVAGAPVQARADAGTIYRDGGTDDADKWTIDDALKRWNQFITSPAHKTIDLSGESAAGVKQKAAFGNKSGRGYRRYLKTSAAPFERGDYARGLGLEVSKVERDLKELHAQKQAEAKIFKVGATGQRWAWIDDTGATSPVESLQEEARKKPDPDKSFRSVANGVKKLQEDGFLTSFTSVTVDPGVVVKIDPDRDDAYTDEEASAVREGLRQAIANEPGFKWNSTDHWGKFFEKVVTPALFEQALQGAAFGLLVQNNLKEAGYTLNAAQVIIYDTRFQTDKLKRQGDGFSTQGTNTIVDFKSGASKAPKVGDDEYKQAQDYYLIVSGVDSGGTAGKKPKADNVAGVKEFEFTTCAYIFATPDVAKDWAPVLRQAFRGDPGNQLKIFPPVDGFGTIPITTNPTFQIPLKDKNATTHVIADPFFHGGVKATKVTLNTKGPGSVELVSGNLEMAADLGGAVTSAPQTKPITPATGAAGGTFDSKFDKVKTSLGDILHRIEPNIRITDNGVEGELKVTAGPSGIPSINLTDSTITVAYGSDGQLTVGGSVGLQHASGKFSATVNVTWSNGNWNLAGTVTLQAGMVEGLSQVTGTVKYENGAWKIGIAEAAYTRTFKAITLTGKVYGCEYDFAKGAFSGFAEVTADLGMFGTAGATAELKDNKLTKLVLSYDSPELSYPAKSPTPAFKGTIGGSLTYEDGKFSGAVNGTAKLNVPALQKIAGDAGLGLRLDAHVNADGSYGGTIGTTTPLKFGKYFEIPSVACTINDDGSVTGDFSIAIKNIKHLENAQIGCRIDKTGFHVVSANIHASFGQPTDKMWGSLDVGYAETTGLAITGTLNVKIKEGMIATGTLTYNSDKNEIDVSLTVQEITLFDFSKSQSLFKFSKQIPLVSFYSIIGIYLDLGLDLDFDFTMKLGLKPTITLDGLSFETWEYKKIAAAIELTGQLRAALTATPKLGLGLFAISPSLLRGGGGLKMPITAEALLTPKAMLQVGYTPSGGVEGDATIGMQLTFGIKGALQPYAEAAVLDGMWNPTWTGDALTEFEILPPKELFSFTLDLAGDMKPKQPQIPTSPQAPTTPTAARQLPQDAPKTNQVGDNGPGRDAVPPTTAPAGGGGADDSMFKMSSLMGALKGLPGYQTISGFMDKAAKVWDQIKGFFGRVVKAFKNFFAGIEAQLEEVLNGFAKEGLAYLPKLIQKIVGPEVWDVIEPIINAAAGSAEQILQLFETAPPANAADFFPWSLKLMQKAFGIGFDSIPALINALRVMMGRLAGLATKIVNQMVQRGMIGVKRHQYYYWAFGDHYFLAADEYKINMLGVNYYFRETGLLINPNDLVGAGLFDVLEQMGVPPTNTARDDKTGDTYRDRWV